MGEEHGEGRTQAGGAAATRGKQASLDPEGLRTDLQTGSCACAGHSWVGVLHLLHPLFGLFGVMRTGCPTPCEAWRLRTGPMAPQAAPQPLSPGEPGGRTA